MKENSQPSHNKKREEKTGYPKFALAQQACNLAIQLRQGSYLPARQIYHGFHFVRCADFKGYSHGHPVHDVRSAAALRDEHLLSAV
jgi:hypothetical protein